MAAYQSFTSVRSTLPDLAGLTTAVRAAVSAEVGVRIDDAQHYTMKKATAWSAGDISAAQGVLDSYVPATPQILGQREIDNLPIATKAIVLALIDQLNVIRAALSPPKADITPAQAIAAIRAKAGTL